MKTASYNDLNTVLIEKQAVYFGGMHLTYQLFTYPREAPLVYRLQVKMEEQSCEVRLAGNLSYAIDCFRQTVNACVTPCALESSVMLFRGM